MIINGKQWYIFLVKPTSKFLLRPDSTYSLGSCDKKTYSIYLNNSLTKRKMKKVLCHEIVHAVMFSYNIFLTYEQEELVAELISTFGQKIITITNKTFKELFY